LSCGRYTAGTVKNSDRNGKRSPAYKLILFAGSLARSQRHLRPSLPHSRRKTGLGYKGVVAFCGNNQQVVAKQGYECISSAVNTVARRVRWLSFCFGPSLKGRRFCACSRVRRRGVWGPRGRQGEGRGPRDDIYDRRRRRRTTKSFSFIVSWTPRHPRRSAFVAPWGIPLDSLRREIPDFLLTNGLPSLALNFLPLYLFFAH
jgi:hypothetical protein